MVTYTVFSETTTFASTFGFHLTEIGHLQPPTRSLGSEYTKNAFVAAYAFLVLFRAQGTCLVAANVVSPLVEAKSAFPNPLAGFQGPLRGGKRRRRGQEGSGK